MQTAYQAVLETIASAKARCPKDKSYCDQVELLAVSKLQPVEVVETFYEQTGHRLFGENYVDELLAKASALPPDIQWHFIGNLQTNKVKKLLACPNLHAVHSVHSEKLAGLLNTHWLNVPRERGLDTFIQVNISREVTKAGLVEDRDVHHLCAYIHKQCPNLRLVGLMAIPHADPERARLELRDLRILQETIRTSLSSNDKNADTDNLDFLNGVSAGMSGHLQEAIEEGSTIVRVGTSLFGARPSK